MSKESNNEWELSLDSEAFLLMKTQFNRMLTNMLKHMQSKEAQDGTIAVKIDVKLEQATVPVGMDGTKTRSSTKPVFDYKINVAIQQKGEEKGECGGDGYELVFDAEMDKYILQKIKNPQTDLFEEPEAEEDGETIEMPDNSREVRMLPSASNFAHVDAFKRARNARKKPILIEAKVEEEDDEEEHRLLQEAAEALARRRAHPPLMEPAYDEDGNPFPIDLSEVLPDEDDGVDGDSEEDNRYLQRDKPSRGKPSRRKKTV